MYEATVTLKYTSKWTHKGGIYDDEILPEENFTFKVPAQDLNSIQLFNLFSKFMLSMGHNQQGIDKGALSLVFNDMRSMEDMSKAAEEYELKMAEDYSKEFREMQDQIYDLKAKLSRYQQPDNPQYTAEEMDAMTAQNEVTAQTLKNAQVICHDCGDKYGTYSVGCSSTWQGKCGVCGETKGVTEVRDYGYLSKGIKELSK
jgi:hypothetical protein